MARLSGEGIGLLAWLVELSGLVDDSYDGLDEHSGTKDIDSTYIYIYYTVLYTHTHEFTLGCKNYIVTSMYKRYLIKSSF